MDLKYKSEARRTVHMEEETTWWSRGEAVWNQVWLGGEVKI